MNKETAFYQDIMLQKFIVGTFYNPTRFLMLYAMTKDGRFKNKYAIGEIVSYLFNAYCDNPHIAEHHPDIQIRKVPYFGVDAIKKDLLESIVEWISFAKTDTILWDGNNIIFNLDDNSGFIAKQVQKILQVLFRKHFNTDFDGVHNLDYSLLHDDTNLKCFGLGKYRERVFADMQYCPLCDDYNINNLYVVHILPATMCTDNSQLDDINNGLIMCQEHATMYLNKQFYFDQRGKVVSSNIDLNNLRLPIAIYKPRKKYIDMYYVNKDN